MYLIRDVCSSLGMCVASKKIHPYRSIYAPPVVINGDAFSLSVKLNCGFLAVIQTDRYCSIQQTEQLYSYVFFGVAYW